MITTITKDNQAKYQVLFDEAADILMGFKRVYTYTQGSVYYYKNADWVYGDDESTLYIDANVENAVNFIDKLREYGALYIAIKNSDGEIIKAPGFNPGLSITTIEEYYSWIKNLGEIDRKYTALPLDEEYFTINANTRGITIPPSFKKNGIGVQGDHIAEVVYFKIDRYFDYIDFNNTDIYIQWELPKNENGVVVKGVSHEYLRDIESEPGKLIFGWALSDIITATPGSVKFSVRFFEWDDPTSANKKLVYNFSTLTATTMIQNALNYNLTDEGLVVDDAGERIQERLENSIVAGGYIAAEPVFEHDLTDIADLNDITGTYTLEVQANSSDAGDVSYEWKKEFITTATKEDGSTIPVGTIIKLIGHNDYNEIEYEDMEIGRNYYYKNGSSEHYLNYMGSIPPADNFVYPIYEKVATCTVDTAGKYWAVATNRVGSTVCAKPSVVCTFPLPTEVANITHPANKVILTVDEDGETNESNITVGASNTDGVLSYEWYFNPNFNLNFGGQTEPPVWDLVYITEEVSDVDDEGNAITETITVPAHSATLAVTEPGHYKAKIINTRNKETKEAYTDISRVTYSAQAPVIIALGVKEGQFEDSTLSEDNCPRVRLEETIPSDGYTIEWFKHNDGVNDYALNLEDKEAFTFNPAELEEYPDGTILGGYYAIVTNHLNGSTASARTEHYTVI